MNEKFSLVESGFIDEISSAYKIFTHNKTKARVIKFENDDDNKAFMIGFRTIPENSKGIMHIIEHAVLSGSKKYTTKEPFMDLAKSSLATFLNAMTFQNMTVYPISSRNAKDFYNLMDVYLDAVFNPRLLTDKKVFLQEGTRCEIFNKEDEIQYQGVVYNEMKGAMSSSEEFIYQAMQEEMYPGNYPAFNSGGDPYEIIKLTYDELLDYYRRHYHPSNSFTVLYGDGDVDAELEHLDEFLSAYEYKEIPNKIAMTKPEAAHKTIERAYPNDVSDKHNYAYSFITGDIDNTRDSIMTEFLSKYLSYFSNSPLKKKIQEMGIASDLLSYSNYGYGNGNFTDINMILKDADGGKANIFKDAVEEELENIKAGRINGDIYDSALNLMDFTLKEFANTATKGIALALKAVAMWLFDKSPATAFAYNATLEELKKDKNAFINFVKEVHKDPKLIDFYPVKDFYKDRDEAERKALDEYKAKLSDEELEALIKENEDLKAMQEAGDSKEALASIPTLKLSDLPRDIEKLPLEKISDSAYYSKEDSKICYLNLFFDISHIAEDDYVKVANLVDLLADIKTTKSSREKLETDIFKTTGAINFAASVVKNYKNGKLTPFVQCSAKFTKDKAVDAMKLIDEIIKYSDPRDEKVLKMNVLESVSDFDNNVLNIAPAIAMDVAKAQSLEKERLTLKLHGIEKFIHLKKLKANFDELKDKEIKDYERLMKTMFRREGFISHYSFEGKIPELDKAIADLEASLESADAPAINTEKTMEKKNTKFIVSSKVYFNGMATDLDSDNDGDVEVLRQILSNDYLHTEIRAKGGAYGDGLNAGIDYLAEFTFRDPHVSRSLDVMRKSAEFLEGCELDQDELERRKIASTLKFNKAYGKGQKGKLAFVRMLQGMTEEDDLKAYREILDTDLDILKEKYLDKLKRFENAPVAVIGPESDDGIEYDEVIDIR